MGQLEKCQAIISGKKGYEKKARSLGFKPFYVARDVVSKVKIRLLSFSLVLSFVSFARL